MESESASSIGATNNGYQHPLEELHAISDQCGFNLSDERFARLMDERDPLRHLRNEYHYPTMSQILNSESGLPSCRFRISSVFRDNNDNLANCALGYIFFIFKPRAIDLLHNCNANVKETIKVLPYQGYGLHLCNPILFKLAFIFL